MYWRDKYLEICQKRPAGCQSLSISAGYSSFSPNERIIFNVGSFLDCIELDGIRYFSDGVRGFYSCTSSLYGKAETLTDTLEDLKKINATEILKYLNQINSLFPNGYPPNDCGQRIEILQRLKDQYYSLFKEFEERYHSELKKDLEQKLEAICEKI